MSAPAPSATPDSRASTHAPAVEILGVSHQYAGAAVPALDNISLRVESGERLGILGPNGGGKSTLLKLVLGLLPLQSGQIRVCGVSPAEARRRGFIGYVAQRAQLELSLPLSVREAVTLGAAWRTRPWNPPSQAVQDRVQRALELTGAAAFASQPIGRLSGGQLQRALIARALAAEARILALDEPMVGIDAAGQAQFAQLLDQLRRELHLTTLIISHDLRAIAAGSDRVACLARRLHSHTSPQGLTPQVLAELFTHDVAGLGAVPSSLAGMHIHAHSAAEPCPPGQPAGPGGHLHGPNDPCPPPCPGCGHDHGGPPSVTPPECRS